MKLLCDIDVEIERGKQILKEEYLHQPIASWESTIFISKVAKFLIFMYISLCILCNFKKYLKNIKLCLHHFFCDKYTIHLYSQKEYSSHYTSSTLGRTTDFCVIPKEMYNARI